MSGKIFSRIFFILMSCMLFAFQGRDVPWDGTSMSGRAEQTGPEIVLPLKDLEGKLELLTNITIRWAQTILSGMSGLGWRSMAWTSPGLSTFTSQNQPRSNQEEMIKLHVEEVYCVLKAPYRICVLGFLATNLGCLKKR